MAGLDSVTEEDIAQYLLQTPAFFERHVDVLASVELSSPHGGRTVSLQERQTQMLRQKIKVLEQNLMELMRHGNDNMLISDRVLNWARGLFLVRRAAELPSVLCQSLQAEFDVPQAAVKLWGVAEPFVEADFAQGVDEEVRSFAESLVQPYCGVDTGFSPVQWLDDPAAVASLALLPLRYEQTAFGLLVLASPDSARYQASMATDFLERMADLAGAALSRLRDN